MRRAGRQRSSSARSGDSGLRPPAGRQRPESGLLRLRKTLGSLPNLPLRWSYPGFEHVGPFRADRVAGTDILFVRELTGGLYFGEPRGFDARAARSPSTRLRYSDEEVRRVARVAFEAARKAPAAVTLVDKANVLETSQLWRRVVSEVATDYRATSDSIIFTWMPAR